MIPNELKVFGAGSEIVNGIYIRGQDINGMPAWYTKSLFSLQYRNMWVVKANKQYTVWILVDMENGKIYYKADGCKPPRWEAIEGVEPCPQITLK